MFTHRERSNAFLLAFLPSPPASLHHGRLPLSPLFAFILFSFYTKVTTIRIFAICMRHDSAVNVGRRELSRVSGLTTRPYERFNLRSLV